MGYLHSEFIRFRKAAVCHATTSRLIEERQRLLRSEEMVKIILGRHINYAVEMISTLLEMCSSPPYTYPIKMIELDNRHETRSYKYFNLMADTHTHVNARNINALIPNTEKSI